MGTWLRRARGAIGMGLTWAAGWALAGLMIGVSSVLLPWLPWGAFFEVFDAPLPALAIPGFVGGLTFSLVLGTLGRRRRFDELSLPRIAMWGAAGGLLLSLVPAAMSAVGLASIHPDAGGVWGLTAVISGPLVLFSACSAAATLMLARKAQNSGTRAATGGEDEPVLVPRGREPAEPAVAVQAPDDSARQREHARPSPASGQGNA